MMKINEELNERINRRINELNEYCRECKKTVKLKCETCPINYDVKNYIKNKKVGG